jgi:hypothetical protein
MDVWIYFEQRERECEDMSLSPADLGFAEEDGSNGRRGKIIGHVYFDDDVYLEVSESVVVVGNHIRRIDYAYFLVIEGEEVWGFERDPTHDPPVHGHGTGHTRIPSGPVAFKKALEFGWHEVALRSAP